MKQTSNKTKIDLSAYLSKFSLQSRSQTLPVFSERPTENKKSFVAILDQKYPAFDNEFWTPRQRQASSLHEVSYRACFKPQLPRFFIELFTKKGDIVYDPFSGRGTTAVEAGLLSRKVVANDINPLSQVLSRPRFFLPDLRKLSERLYKIQRLKIKQGELKLPMFYHPQTEREILSLREYLVNRKLSGEEDNLDSWIRMVATNRLTGHSKGFFSVYTLPPNQAVSKQEQEKINKKRKQLPEYRNTTDLIMKKSASLLRSVTSTESAALRRAGKDALFLSCDARKTETIKNNYIQLSVTSPPFLDVVNYTKDNWLRCWFNNIDDTSVSEKMTVTKDLAQWSSVMSDVFKELYRITKKGGYVAFEVGEVRKGQVRLEQYVIPLGLAAGFDCVCVMINRQKFTKTSNIWGVRNNEKGTNTNRIVIFRKS